MCIFASHYLPYLGGVERYVYNLAKGLTGKGYNVIIVTSDTEEGPHYEVKSEATIVRMPSIKLMNGRLPVWKYNKETKHWIDELDKCGIDYIIINTRFYVLSCFAAKYAEKRGIPCYLIEHGTGHLSFNNKIIDLCGQIYEHALTTYVRKYVKNYYGVSWACAEWIKHFKINANGVLYNAIDLENIKKLSENGNDEIKKLIDYHETDLIITYTGRLIKEKGILKLVDAVQRIHDKYPNVKLCVAGDGELLGQLKEANYGYVFLLGKLPFEKVVQLLNLTAIYCLPTDYPEGLPTSVLEAIACNNYIVTTSSGGAKEVIISDEYGVILEENNVDNIYDAIIAAIENPGMREQKNKNAYQRLIDNFTWEHTVNELVNIFNEKGER